jgi:hypothetical protein
MILYHGSNIAIDIIDLSKSKPNKDFGKAFYLSEQKQQAEEMAVFTVERFGGEPIVTTFEFDETWLNNAQLCYLSFNEYSREWADFILANRDADTETNIHNYDIVYGPIANDSVGRQIFNLKEGYIDFEEFMKRLHYMKGITFQYAFCTPKAIEKLKRL